jgi:hypothetical protein
MTGSACSKKSKNKKPVIFEKFVIGFEESVVYG